MKNLLIYALVILLAVSFLRMSSFSNNNQQQVEIVYGESYSEFVKGVESGNVKDVYITTYDNYQTISGTTVDGKTFNMAINLDSGDLIDSLVESGVICALQDGVSNLVSAGSLIVNSSYMMHGYFTPVREQRLS